MLSLSLSLSLSIYIYIYIYTHKYASLIEEANEIFHVYNKTEIRKERETKYHFEEKRTGNKWKICRKACLKFTVGKTAVI